MSVSPFPDFEPDFSAEVERLRQLPELEFERIYRAEAVSLGVPPATLKRVVTKARKDAEREKRDARRQECAFERSAMVRNAHDDLDGLILNEDGIALAFTKAHRERLRYCHHVQSWFLWTGSIWCREETRLAFSWARKICRDRAANLNPDDKVRNILARASSAAAVERYAQADRAFAVTASTWDQNRWLLGTPNGTVDLRSGALRQADKSDHITKKTAVAPAPPGTPHPIWTVFLDLATGGDDTTKAFLQRFAGYCLTGDVTEEVLAFLYGDGGAGKGTFIGAIAGVMNDYAVSVPIEVFTAGSRLNLEYYRAMMAGARLVTASETEAGAAWAESQIKELTGNETPLPARHPYGKPFNFWPHFKICLVGNHAPRLKAKSKAMERRLRIIPFEHKPLKPDVGLKEKLRGEYPAILRWIIDGCLIWQRDRVGTCAAVETATGSYFAQQDAFGRWLADRCVIASTINPLSEKPSRLLMDYLAWLKDNGEQAIPSTEFREMIERTPGLRYATNKGTQWVRGIGLKAAEGYQDHRAGYDR
jgi:putative DNA primase/helicase